MDDVVDCGEYRSSSDGEALVMPSLHVSETQEPQTASSEDADADAEQNIVATTTRSLSNAPIEVLRRNKPISILSKASQHIKRKPRPVSASVLQVRLPLKLPLSDIHHEATVVLSARDVRPYNTFRKYQTMDKQQQQSIAYYQPPPPEPNVRFEGPVFYRHFGKARDVFMRPPPTWGPRQKEPPEAIIHNDFPGSYLNGPWK
jgi:hypothetical protein